MDIESEIYSLSGETLAFSLIIGNVLRNVAALSPELAAAIRLGFDQAASQAEDIAIRHGPSASPKHTIHGGRVIEDIRPAVFPDEGQPRGII